MSIEKNYLFNTSYQLLKLVTPLVSTPYLSRILSPEGVGYYSYTYSVANIFFLIAVLGMENYGVRLIASAGDNRERRSRSFWGAYFAQVMVGALVVLAYCAFSLLVEPEYIPINLLWTPWIVSAMIDISWLYFGVQEFKMPAIRSSVMKLLTLAAIFILVKKSEDLWLYVVITSCGTLLEQLTLWPFAARYVDRAALRVSDVTQHIRPNLTLFVPVVAINCYTTLDKIILGNLTNLTEVGYFEYSEKMCRMPLTLITALGTVALPKMSRVWEEGEKDRALDYISSSFWLASAVSFAFMFGIIGVVRVFVPVFFGSDYMACIELMTILSLIIPAVAWTNVIGSQYLLPRYKDRVYTLSVLVAACVNIGLNFMLIPHYGSMGTSVALVVTEYTVLFAQIISVRDALPIRKLLLITVPALACGMLMMVMLQLIESALVSIFGANAFVLLAEVVFGACLYTALFSVWNLVTRNQQFSNLLGRVRTLFSQ